MSKTILINQVTILDITARYVKCSKYNNNIIKQYVICQKCCIDEKCDGRDVVKH